jgi:hypothetical protein
LAAAAKHLKEKKKVPSEKVSDVSLILFFHHFSGHLKIIWGSLRLLKINMLWDRKMHPKLKI